MNLQSIAHLQTSTTLLFTVAVALHLAPLAGAAPHSPVKLAGYDPSGQIRFTTPAQAEAKRQELIRFIWTGGFPTNALPKVVTNVSPAVFSADLAGLNSALAASVDRLEAVVAPYDFRDLSYLVRPRAVNANNRRLVLLNSGHRKGGAFDYGVNDAANRLLGEGFQVLMTDMPVVGFNTNNTLVLPGGGTVTITNRGSAGHREMFAKLTPPVLPDGEIFRLFLEPMVQGVNHFLRATPNAVDVSYVGLSGGGWTGHMLAAVDPRVKQSFPVAGSYPLYARPKGMSHDDEQFYEPLYREVDSNGDGIADTAAGVASWLEIYALGGYGSGRRQIQILNLYDSCCFNGDTFQTYTNFVSTVVRNLGRGEWGFHSDASHRDHLISPIVLNQVILPGLVGANANPDSAKPELARKPVSTGGPIAPLDTPFPMPQLQRPVFPDRSFNIEKFGAVADGVTKNTKAFADAIAACAQAGGGKVLVPAGKWLTGAIHLKSRVNLHMEEGAEIHFSDEPSDYLPVVFTRWAGFEVMNYSPLIYANGCENIAITGPGKLFGHGEKWWPWCQRLDERNKVAPLLESYGQNHTPVAQRVFGNPDTGLRPQFISPINCTNVLLEGFTIATAGPFWTIQLVYCENVIARGLTVHTKQKPGGPKQPNTDGLNLDSSRNALVEHCFIDAGDDAVCLKSGINADGRRVARPTENVVVRHVTAHWCHGGVVIGSDTSGGVRNVLAHDCRFEGSNVGIRLKSNAARGGVVENIHYRDIAMRDIKSDAIQLVTDYAAWGAAGNETHYPVFRNIFIRNVNCDGAAGAANIQATVHQPIENLELDNVSIKAKAGMKFNWVQGLKLRNVTSKPASGEPISIRNCVSVDTEP